MATIKLHGKKALIIQHFNALPDLTIMEFEWNYIHNHRLSVISWQKILFKNNNMR